MRYLRKSKYAQRTSYNKTFGATAPRGASHSLRFLCDFAELPSDTLCQTKSELLQIILCPCLALVTTENYPTNVSLSVRKVQMQTSTGLACGIHPSLLNVVHPTNVSLNAKRLFYVEQLERISLHWYPINVSLAAT